MCSRAGTILNLEMKFQAILISFSTQQPLHTFLAIESHNRFKLSVSNQMRRNSKSTTSLVSLNSLGISDGKESLKKRKPQTGIGGFSILPFLENIKGNMVRVKSSSSFDSKRMSRNSSNGRRPSLNFPTTIKAKSRMTRNTKSLTSLTSLDKEPACFSHLATPSALSILEQADSSLEEIGYDESSRSSSCMSLPAHEIDEFSPVFIEEDDSVNVRNPHSSQRGSHIQRVDRDLYHRVCKIGRGAHSNVYMVLDHKREKCAMKVLDPSRLKNPETFVTAALDLAMEAKLLSELEHENIIQLRGVSSSAFSASYTEGNGEGYFLVMDLLSEVLSDSLDRWRKDRQSLAFGNKMSFGKFKVNTEMMYERMQNVALGIVKGMTYLHENGIVIRDLKPANVGFDETGNVRLFDFGMACKLEDCHPDEICGSPRYMPPEVMAGKGYSYEADVYSFGIILYEICSLNIAFENSRKCEDRKAFNRQVIEQDMRPKLNRIPCPLTKELIKDCWQGDPTQRPSFKEIYKRIVNIIS